MKVKTSELTGAALNWAVASIEWPNDTGILEPDVMDKQYVNEVYPYDTDWSITGPLVDSHRISVKFELFAPDEPWVATIDKKTRRITSFADTALKAILRCLIASKLGDEVEVPNHLL